MGIARLIMKSKLIAFIWGVLFWLALNNSIDTPVLIVGGVVSAVIALLFVKGDLFKDCSLSPKAFVAAISWFLIFSVELIKSNIDVALRVISPKVRINPAIVECKTKLKSKMGRMALANSITLTPGTLTTDIIDDKLYIHWIDATSTDVDGATKKIVEKFEKPLEVIFG